MVLKNIDGLIVKERATVGDKISLAATKNKSCWSVNRQGNGIAAATAVKSNHNIRNVDIANLQREKNKA